MLYIDVISPFLALFAPMFGVEFTVNDLPKKSVVGIASTFLNISESLTGIVGWE